MRYCCWGGGGGGLKSHPLPGGVWLITASRCLLLTLQLNNPTSEFLSEAVSSAAMKRKNTKQHISITDSCHLDVGLEDNQ